MKYFLHCKEKEIEMIVDGKPKLETWLFVDWFKVVVGTDDKITKSLVTQMSAKKAIEAVKSTPEGEYVAIEDEDYRLVESIMKEPKGFAPWVGWQLSEWAESTLDAKKVKPGSTAVAAE